MDKLVTKQIDLMERISSTTKNMGVAITQGEVKTRLKLLEKNWNTFCKTHEQLLVYSATYMDDPYFRRNYMSICQENYVRQKAILMDLMEKKQGKTSAGKTKPSPGTSSRRSLPKETGNYELIDEQLERLMALKPIKRVSLPSLKRLLKGTMDAVKKLKALNRPVQYWDDWLVFITVDRLDPTTRTEWEIFIGSTLDPPTFAELTNFLTSRLRALEAKKEVPKQGWRAPVKPPRNNNPNVAFASTSTGGIFVKW